MMKYNILTLSVIALGLWGCAHQSISSQTTPINQKIYRSYEQLLSNQSYAFEGSMRFDAVPAIKNENNKAAETVSEEYQFREKLLQDIFAVDGLDRKQQVFMQDGLKEFKQLKSKKALDINLTTLGKTILNRYYYTFDGVVDLGHGQVSLNPRIGYSAKNLQMWMSLPMVLDLQKYRAYVDTSALSPVVTDPKYDGQYVFFDFADIVKKSNYDLQPLFSLVRELSLVSPVMADPKNYQYITLSAEDKKRGGVEKIRYIGGSRLLFVDYYLYFYLNQKYLSTVLPNAHQEQFDTLSSDHGVNNEPNQAQRDVAEAEAAAEAAQEDYPIHLAVMRLEEAIKALTTESIVDDRPSLTSYFEEASPQKALPSAHDVALLATQQAAEETVSAIVSGATSSIAYDHTKVMEQLESEGIEDIARYRQQEQALETFAQYQSNQLINAKQFKQIVDEQPKAYEAFKASIDELVSADIFQISNYVMDMVLDRDGRLIRMEMIADQDLRLPDSALGNKVKEQLNLKSVKTQIQMNIHSYGSARVNQPGLKQAVSFKDAANQNTLLQLGDTFESFKQSLIGEVVTTEEDVSNDISNQERYNILAKQLMAQKMSFVEAYAIVYKYAYILEGEDIYAEDFSMSDLNDTAYWAAIYYATEQGMPYTEKQYNEYIQAPDHWNYYDDGYIGGVVWDAFNLLDIKRYSKWTAEYNKLKQQGKSAAIIFSQLYTMQELEARKFRGQTQSIDPRLQKFIKALGQVAAKDLQTEEVDKTLLKEFSAQELDQFNNDIYYKVYQLFLR